jgi:hypothetical protein
VLFLGACALLLFIVFPRIQDKLPWNDVTIDQPSHSSSTPTPGP